MQKRTSMAGFPVLRNGYRIHVWETDGAGVADILLVIEASGMEQDQDDHNFCIAHTVGLVAMLV